jgi:hypothetical protein
MSEKEPSRSWDHRQRRRPRPERRPETDPPTISHPSAGADETGPGAERTTEGSLQPQAASVIAVVDSSRASLEAVLLGAAIAHRCGATLVVACFLHPPRTLYGCLTCVVPAWPAGLAVAATAREVRQQVATLLDLEPPGTWDFCCSTGSAQSALRPWCADRSAVAVVTRGPRSLWRREDLRALAMQFRLMCLRPRPTLVLA